MALKSTEREHNFVYISSYHCKNEIMKMEMMTKHFLFLSF